MKVFLVWECAVEDQKVIFVTADAKAALARVKLEEERWPGYWHGYEEWDLETGEMVKAK